jgi:diaminohydroxyphosphoribosylaminopyrimidine deaminase / 5-amino-6-(5-phosphoribosylamino)uracil reductase
MTDFTPLMSQAIILASRGRGAVEPNPMVGAIVLDARGQIVGEGFHERFGGPHAEVNALKLAGDRAQDGTIIVTLEPCSHHGKTPPCTDAIIAAGIRHVVIAMPDPFPQVNGGGIQRLREAGISITSGIKDADAMRLNAPYLTRLRDGRPWVIAKWAMTLDGNIATKTGDSKWISGEESRADVHRVRGLVDAIIIGAVTLRRDDPLLTARPPGPRIPARIVATKNGRLPGHCQLLKTIAQAPVIVWTQTLDPSLSTWREAGAEILTGPLDDFLKILGDRGMTNVVVEGGSQLLGLFFDANRIDEVMIYVAPILTGGVQAKHPLAGIGVETIAKAGSLDDMTVDRLGRDLVIRGRIKKLF